MLHKSFSVHPNQTRFLKNDTAEVIVLICLLLLAGSLRLLG